MELKNHELSAKVKELNDIFIKLGCKFLSDGRIRYFVPVKDNQSAITCDWTVVMGTVDGIGGNKYEKCANITVNKDCKSTIRIYTNVLKVVPSSMADAEIKYEVSHMTYSAVSGSTFELIYKMNQALCEQMKEFLEDYGKTDLAETKSNVTTVKESNLKSKKTKKSTTKSTTKSTKTKKG